MLWSVTVICLLMHLPYGNAVYIVYIYTVIHVYIRTYHWWWFRMPLDNELGGICCKNIIIVDVTSYGYIYMVYTPTQLLKAASL